MLVAPHAPGKSRRLRPRRREHPAGTHLPPHGPRNRGDCGIRLCHRSLRNIGRLTPPGIAATAARRDAATRRRAEPASRPPESRRLRHYGLHALAKDYYANSAAPRPPESCGDCGTANTNFSGTALHRARPPRPPPGIAATAAARRAPSGQWDHESAPRPRNRGDRGASGVAEF